MTKPTDSLQIFVGGNADLHGDTSAETELHDIEILIRPPLQPGHSLVIMLRDNQCQYQVVEATDTKRLHLDAIFKEGKRETRQ